LSMRSSIQRPFRFRSTPESVHFNLPENRPSPLEPKVRLQGFHPRPFPGQLLQAHRLGGPATRERFGRTSSACHLSLTLHVPGFFHQFSLRATLAPKRFGFTQSFPVFETRYTSTPGFIHPDFIFTLNRSIQVRSDPTSETPKRLRHFFQLSPRSSHSRSRSRYLDPVLGPLPSGSELPSV
jgi:hypothetical protein